MKQDHTPDLHITPSDAATTSMWDELPQEARDALEWGARVSVPEARATARAAIAKLKDTEGEILHRESSWRGDAFLGEPSRELPSGEIVSTPVVVFPAPTPPKRT